MGDTTEEGELEAVELEPPPPPPLRVKRLCGEVTEEVEVEWWWW